MPTYYAPGTRKGNRSWTVRGSVDGREYEITTRERDKRAARRAWDSFVQKVRARRADDEHEALTFETVADRYAVARNLSRPNRRFLDRLKTELGGRLVAEIRSAEIAEAAVALYPTGSNATRNRNAIVPAAAVLHFAADNELCSYVVVRKLKEDEPETRRPAPNVREILLANTAGEQHALLTVLFFQGWRVSEALRLRAEHVDLQAGTLRLYVSKARRWKSMPLHTATTAALANLPMPESGPVWPWSSRFEIYRWLRPLCARLKVHFTPHMARHDFASRLRQRGAGRRDLVDIGTWTSEKSVERYMSADAEHARNILSRLEAGEEKQRRSRGKTRGA